MSNNKARFPKISDTRVADRTKSDTLELVYRIRYNIADVFEIENKTGTVSRFHLFFRIFYPLFRSIFISLHEYHMDTSLADTVSHESLRTVENGTLQRK